jgi:hypothetical protein
LEVLVSFSIFFVDAVAGFSTIEDLDGTLLGDRGKDVGVNGMEFEILGFVIKSGTVEDCHNFGGTKVTMNYLVTVAGCT